MAKLQVYKFVNPGSTSSGNLEIAAARTQTLAVNRLGSTVESIGKIVLDIQKVGTLNAAAIKATALGEQRRLRLQKDAEAESAQEFEKSKKKEPGQNEFGNAAKKVAEKSVSWVDKFLGPIGSFLLGMGSWLAVKEILAWTADPENKEKLQTFVERTDFVFKKIYGWAKGLVTNVLEGFTDLVAPNSDFGERLKGLGKLMVGIIGLKYLMNPFSLISDILSLFELFSTRKPTKPTTRPQGTTTTQQTQRFRDSRTRLPGQTRAGSSLELEQARRNARATTQPVRPSRTAALRAQLQTGSANVPLSPGLQRAAYNAPKNIAQATKAARLATQNAVRRVPIIGSLLAGVFTFFEDADGDGKPDYNLEKSLFVAGGAALGGFLGSFIPIPVLGTALGAILGEYVGELFYILLRGGGPEALGKKLQKDITELLSAGELVLGWTRDGLGRFMEGMPKMTLPLVGEVPDPRWMMNPINIVDKAKLFAKAFFSRDPMNPKKAEKRPIGVTAVLKGKTVYWAGEDYGWQQETTFNTLKESGKIVIPPGGDGHAIGGQVKIPEMGIGGFFNSIGQGISNVVSGVGKAVSSVVSNPIVQTAASFIPGAAPIMATIGAVSGLASGNPLGALASGIGMIPGVGAIMNSPVGQIATNLIGGNFGGAINAGLGMIPGLGGTLGSIVNQGVGFALGTGPGGTSDLIGSIAGNLANQFNLGGLYKAITGFMGGNYADGMSQLAGELGVDPKYLGVTRTAAGAATQALSKEGISAKYAMEQALELVPVPVIIEKLVPMPMAVPINTGGGAQVVSAGPSNLTQRTQ